MAINVLVNSCLICSFAKILIGKKWNIRQES